MATSNRPVYGLVDKNNQPVMNPVTGKRVMRQAPFGYVHTGAIPSEVVMYSTGWTEYTGAVSALSSACGVITPAPGNPVWVLASLPQATAGTDYSETFAIDQVGTPSAGRTLVRVVANALPAWLSLVDVYGENSFALRGRVPEGITSFEVTLLLQQSVSGETAKTFTVTVAANVVYAYYVYNDQNDNTLAVYVGGDGASSPVLTTLSTPSAYPYGGSFTMPRRQPIGLAPGIAYFVQPLVGIVTGTYVGQIVHLGKTRYFSLDIVQGVSGQNTLALSASPISLPVASAPAGDGSAEPIEAPTTPVDTRITLVQRRYDGTDLHYYVRGTTASGTGPYYVQQRHLPAQAGGAMVWSPWQDGLQFELVSTSPNPVARGDWSANLGSAGLVTQIEFRLVDGSGNVFTAQPVLHYDFTLPGSASNLETLYPAS